MDYSNDSTDIGYRLVVSGAVFAVVVLALFTLRLVAQRLAQRRPGFDDYFLWAALLTFFAFDAICIALPSVGGIGRHEANLLSTGSSYTFRDLSGYLIAGLVLYVSCFTFAKISILGLYLRIFIDKFSKRFVYILIAITVAAWVALIPVIFLQCLPVSPNLWLGDPDAQCIDQEKFYQFMSFPNIVTDVVMLFVPIPTIMRLQVSSTQRIGLIMSFLLGSCGLIAAIVRFVEFGINSPLYDSTWTETDLLVWSVVELTMYIAAACLPTYRPLVHAFRKRMGYSHTSSGLRTTHVQTTKPRTDMELSRLDRRLREDDELGLVNSSNDAVMAPEPVLKKYEHRPQDGRESRSAGEAGIMRTTEVSVTRSERMDF